MKICLIQIDKTQDKYLDDGIAIFYKRLKNYCTFEIETIQMPKNVRAKSFDEQKLEEGKELLKKLKDEDVVVLLDENGKEFNSNQFSKYIVQKQNASTKRLVFIIGGPFGFSPAIYQRANEKIALSQLTFSHQMVRLFFIEQVYRAYTIIKGEKYHHN